MNDNAVSAPPERPDGLQVEEDRQFQRGFWRIQRVGWVLFAIILLAAVAGLTGSGGPWASDLVVLPEGELHHPRMARWDASAQWSVTFNQARPRQQLLLAGDLASHFVVETIQPRPIHSYLTTGGQLMEFATDGPPPHRVVLTLRTWRPGVARVRAEMNGAAAELKIVILP